MNTNTASNEFVNEKRGKPIDFQGVIKPVNLEKDFVIVSREFAQDRTISPFTKDAILDVQSRSEDWETNVGSIMHNFGVGRNKARSVLSEGQAAGYIYAHIPRVAGVGRFDKTTYHFCTCRRSLRDFVIGNGWETPESYALKIQAMAQAPKIGALVQAPKNQAPVNQAPELRGNERRDATKEETQPNAVEGVTEARAPTEHMLSSVEASTTRESIGLPYALKPTVGTSSTVGMRSRQLRVEPRQHNHRWHKPSNTRRTYSDRFEAFWIAYQAVADGMHGSKAEAAIEYDRLSEEDQDAALAAISVHRSKLGDLKFKHACRYLNFRQFDDYAEEVQAASALPSDRAVITDIVFDLMSEPSVPNRIKLHGWLSFGALKQAAPALWHKAVEHATRECHWTPRGEFVALAA